MKSLLLLFLILSCGTIPFIASLATTSCSTSAGCGSNGICSTNGTCNCSTNATCNCSTSGTCNCSKGYVTTDSTKPCAYQQKEKLTVFLLSLLAGSVGADWFYLAAGNGAYIAAGVFKLLTCGGFGIWALVDWIRVLTNKFPDGQGVALSDWR